MAAQLLLDGSTPSAVACLSVDEWDRDMPGIAIPRPEIHLVARFGPSARRGLDVHAFGARLLVHRKILHSGQRTVSARLHLGTSEGVLGVPASEMAGRVVELEDLWEAAAVRQLYDRLASVRDTVAAAAVLERALAERFASAVGRSAHVQLALDAADRLTSAKVHTVATDLGVSERHLRRVFRETLGVSPKEFAKLERFHRALREARKGGRASWANIAAEAGYYDQAHLIAEFRAISGVTPRALLGELRGAASVG
jgi:AraC-like DNA-binding protein